MNKFRKSIIVTAASNNIGNATVKLVGSGIRSLDINQLESRIEAACSKIDSGSDNKIKLLIVDSIIYHYRAECAGRSKLPEKIQRLLKTASSNAVAAVITNHQTQSSVDA